VRRKWVWVFWLLWWPVAWAFAQTAAPAQAGVVVVLAGGGAKGFAHLAVLRRLERDGVKIARLVGTSMGAVIGGLYASGLSTDEIERVIGNLDPAKVALDQIDRQELPLRAREYQRQYPIELEFGLRAGQLGFARGVSDGQRFLALLQELTAHVPPRVNFDELKIPFRAVATRYRDGELTVFREGSLHLAIRASMAAPGVFAPVEVDGETYVDGGLVANLPVDVALQEGADVIVASYLGQSPDNTDASTGNALMVANQMLTILIRQNEKRNLALLRAQDVLIQPQLKEVGFTDFRRAADIAAMGEKAVQAQDVRFAALAQAYGGQQPSQDRLRQRFDEREMLIDEVRVSGTTHTNAEFVSAGFRELKGKQFSAQSVARVIDQLYTSGYFERVSYSLEQIHDGRYALLVDVNEKPYGPHYFKTSLGFASEHHGFNQFAVGLGYRRPWLTASGLELALDAQAGTQSQLGIKLYQPVHAGLGVQAHASYQNNLWPVYAPVDVPVATQGRLAYAQLSKRTAGVDLTQDLGRGAVLRLGWVGHLLDYQLDTAGTVSVPLRDGGTYNLALHDQQLRYGGWRLQWLVDTLDAVSFPERGHYVNAVAEHGVGTPVRSYALNARWAYPYRTHVVNLGLNLGHVDVPAGCVGCSAPAYLYLGGFQNMGAFRTGELVGDRLAHAFMTYMYRWSEGGLLRQKTFLGITAEAGDAWFNGREHATRYSTTVFMATDSKIGDIYLGLARGSGGVTNAFVQLGRRFGW